MTSLKLALLVPCLLLSSCHRTRQMEPLKVQYVEIWADGLNQTFEQICREWATANGRTIEFSRVPLNDLPQRTAEFIEVRGAADVALIPATDAVIHQDVLRPMTDVIGQLQSRGHVPFQIAVDMNYSGGSWVAAPLYSWSHVWIWRADRLREAGLKPPRTFQEAKLVMQALRNKKDNTYGFGIGLGGDDDSKMFTQAVLWSFGASVFDKSGRVVLDSPETKAAFTYVLSLQREGLLPDGVMGWDGASNNRAFLDGSIDATANAPTILYAANRVNKQLASNIDVTLYPEGPAGRHTFATGFSLAIRRDDPRADEGADLIQFLLRDENYTRLIEAAEGSVNPQYSGYDRLKIWSDPRLRVALDSLQYEHPVGWPGPVTRSAAEVFDRHVLTDIYGRVLNDNLSLDEAIAEAARKVEAIVQRNGGK